jgi:hypothetical protein
MPNRTILATGFSPTFPHRQGGQVYFSVQHHFRESPETEADDGTLRKALDAFVGASADSLTISDGNSLQAVADGITAAGRWLAQTDGTPEGDAIASNNADMAHFRCDWVKMGSPFLTRGGKDDGKGGTWVESRNFSAFVSQAAISNDDIQTPTIAGEFYMSGIIPLAQGQTTGQVTGLGIGFVPSKCLLQMVVPDGGEAIAAWVTKGTLSADGFSFALNAAPDSNEYTLEYLILP